MVDAEMEEPDIADPYCDMDHVDEFEEDEFELQVDEGADLVPMDPDDHY